MPDDFVRLIGTVSSGSIEWAAVFSFIAFAVVYFLAPVLGYQAEKRGLLLVSLYLLIGYGLLILLQMLIQYLIYLVSSRGSDTSTPNLVTVFAIFKLMAFLAAQAAFVFGLQALKRGSASRP